MTTPFKRGEVNVAMNVDIILASLVKVAFQQIIRSVSRWLIETRCVCLSPHILMHSKRTVSKDLRGKVCQEVISSLCLDLPFQL